MNVDLTSPTFIRLIRKNKEIILPLVNATNKKTHI